ncbi:hypothetical protein D3C81_1148220 [compost metagenome]
MLDHRHDRVEHQRAVAVLAHFTVEGQADADVGQVFKGTDRHERRQYAGAIEALGAFPRQAFFLQLRLQVAQGQVQGRGEAGDGVEHFFFGRIGRQRLAEQHGNFRLVVHRTAFSRDLEAAVERHHTTARLDEQQGFGRDRVIQLFGVLGIVAPDAHHLAQGKVNTRAVYILVLIAHYRLLALLDALVPVAYSTAKILPGFMIPLGSNAAFTAFMYSISTGERL